MLASLLGLGLILLGLYFLRENVFFTTQTTQLYPYPDWWKGVVSSSILALTGGVVGLFILPRDMKSLAWIPIAFAVLFLFFSNRAAIRPTSLWQLFVSLASMLLGYQLITKGRGVF